MANLEIDGKKVMELKPVKLKPLEKFPEIKCDGTLQITLSNGKNVDIPLTYEKMMEIKGLLEEPSLKEIYMEKWKCLNEAEEIKNVNKHFKIGDRVKANEHAIRVFYGLETTVDEVFPVNEKGQYGFRFYIESIGIFTAYQGWFDKIEEE